MIMLIEKDWVLSWVLGFTPIVKYQFIFLFGRKQQTNVTQITQYLSSFLYCREGFQFRLLRHLLLFQHRLFFFFGFLLVRFLKRWREPSPPLLCYILTIS